MNESIDRKLLFAVWQGFGLMVLVGFILIIVFRFGEVLPFVLDLFDTSDFGIILALAIGLVSGLLMALLVTGVMVLTGTELPKNEMTELLEQIVRMPGGLLTISLGAGFAEEFLFRGVLVGLVIEVWPVWLVLTLNALLFMAVHVPQYRGKPLMHLTIFIMGLWLAFLFYWTSSLLAPIIAHAIYNGVLGYHLKKQGKASDN
ncbi:CPBP family intramembrane glutamic endopeptidase [Geomicrobium sediminis]|uniref:Membrane protease YdiL (CAAX protease family) n=1 Tax=Geomicrobium sediminis TaxID=1347788 RepID=A0ABS2P8G8_9BACL|nr:type II CAAX endopeptidase family protein [Geomicrobium sediminis]MBM7631607.1 membrane protease YdiL (CAAX protease family) [Geomicrobium sediminis]